MTPAICVDCGRGLGSAAVAAVRPAPTSCPHCSAPQAGVRWAPAPEPALRLVGRMATAVALWAASPWGLVLLALVLASRPGSPVEWLTWTALLVLGLVATAAGALAFFAGVELALARDWVFRSDDGRREGRVRMLGTRLVRGRGRVVRVDPLRIEAPLLSTVSLAAVGARVVLDAILPLVAPRFAKDPFWPAWSRDSRREAELALVVALVGMNARRRVALEVERRFDWWKDLSQRQPRVGAVETGVRVAILDGGGRETGGRLERLLLEQWTPAAMQEPPRCDPYRAAPDDAWAPGRDPRPLAALVRTLVGPQLDPWRFVEAQRAQDAAANLGPVGGYGLLPSLEALFAGAPDAMLLLWWEVEKGLMSSALTARELFRSVGTKRAASDLPN